MLVSGSFIKIIISKSILLTIPVHLPCSLSAAWWEENSFIVNISQNNPIPLQDEEVGGVWSPNLSNIISIVVHGRDVTELAQIDFARNNYLYYIMIHRVTGCLERSSVTGPDNFDCNKNKIQKYNTNKF